MPEGVREMSLVLGPPAAPQTVTERRADTALYVARLEGTGEKCPVLKALTSVSLIRAVGVQYLNANTFSSQTS